MSLAKWNASWGHRRLTLALCLVVGATCMALLGSASAAQAATWNVTTTADTSSGTCEPSSCSLRQAIGAASDGDTIVLPGERVRISGRQRPARR